MMRNLINFTENTPLEFSSNCTALPDTHVEEEVEYTTTLSAENLPNLCRLCLEDKTTMWSFFSVITFDDGSVIDVSQTFQNLTGDVIEKMEDLNLPQYICKHCLDLLTNACTFWQKYEESNKILNEYLSQQAKDKIEEYGASIKTTGIKETTEYAKDINGTTSQIFESISTEKKVPVTKAAVKTEVGILEQYEPSGTHKSLKRSDIKTEKVPRLQSKQNDRASVDTKQIQTSRMTTEETITFSVTEETSVKLHRCPICPEEFTALELKKHIRIHKSLSNYLRSAPKYKKKVKFYAKPRSENKGLFHQENVIHTCPFCHEELKIEQFIDHIKQHRTEGDFRCNICNRIFMGINHLKMHKLSHKKEAPFQCKICQKSFFLKKNYDFHLLKHSDQKELPFKCDYCGKMFSHPEHLRRHKFNHENDVSYHQFYRSDMSYIKCKVCLQKFKTQVEKDTHNCKLSCSKCHKLFDTKSKFNKHVCKSKLKRSRCSPCGTVFLLPSSLKAHKLRCKTRTLCYVCGKNVRNITQHLFTHFPNRRKKQVFKCAQCEKQFNYRQNLNRHITEVHLNVIHYRCQYCSKGFKGKWNLQVHERIHLGVKPHVCNICGKGFLEKSYLKKHLRIHMRQEGFVNLLEV